MPNCIIDTTLELDHLGVTHPVWLADYDDAQLDTGGDHETLARLVSTAPTDFARGVVAGRLMLQDQIASALGRQRFASTGPVRQLMP